MPDLAKSAPRPFVVYEGSANVRAAVDATEAAETMRKLKISEETIGLTTLQIFPAALVTRGSTWPKQLSYLRNINNPRLKALPGPLVRISLATHGKIRSEQEINTTLVHEFEHVAQLERRDPRLVIGLATIGAFGVGGGIIGYKLGGSQTSKALLSAAGATVFQQAGYALASHEQQARTRAASIETTAVKLLL